MSSAVTQIATSQAIMTANFIVGFALLVMLFPSASKPVEKPAGVRTAIELIDKRGAKSPVCGIDGVAAV